MSASAPETKAELLHQWEEAKGVLEHKLEHISQLKSYIKQLHMDKFRKDEFTRNGGLFALNKSIPQDEEGEESSIVPGTLEWVVSRRTFVESLPKDFWDKQHGTDFIKKPLSLEEVIIQLESGGISRDAELANYILVACTNCILAQDGKAPTTQFESLIRTISHHLNVQ